MNRNKETIERMAAGFVLQSFSNRPVAICRTEWFCCLSSKSASFFSQLYPLSNYAVNLICVGKVCPWGGPQL